MPKSYTKTCPSTLDEFILAREHFEEMIQRLQIKQLTNHHDEIENRLQKDEQELCRLLFQSALDVMARTVSLDPQYDAPDAGDAS